MKQQSNLRENLRKILNMRGRYMALFALLCVAFSNMQFVSYAGDIAKDTVWTKKTTEGSFYSLQFINNDAVIVAQASGSTVFYDALNSNELRRIAGTNKALFFNEEKNFLRLNNDRKRFEIFDTESLEIIEELESDDLLMQEFGRYVISKDENFVVGVVTNGFRVWDLKTKKILRTKTTDLNENLFDIYIDDIAIIPNKGILAYTEKQYKVDGEQQPVSVRQNILFDFETLDSISNWGYKGGYFAISPSKKYIAYRINGVEIYNLETGEFVSNIKGLNSLVLTGIEFSNDESYVVTSSTVGDNLLAIWEVKSGEQLYEYPRGSISCFDLSTDNKFIVNASGKSIGKWKVTEQMTSVNDNNSQIMLYPNPTNGILEIKYQIQRPNIFQYEITNISGQTLMRNNLGFKNIGENIDTIELSNLPLGQYNLKLYSMTEQFNFKFIKGE